MESGEQKIKNSHAVALGRLGGRKTGPSKARTSAQARRAANARWNRYRAMQLDALTQQINGETKRMVPEEKCTS